VTALWWVTLPLLLVGGGWIAALVWHTRKRWPSKDDYEWRDAWRIVPGTAYDKSGVTDGQR
jgi:hypothetical protein